MVPNDYLPFVYVTCSLFKCGVELYGEGFVNEGKESRQESEDKDATMFHRHNGVDISLFNCLQQILCREVHNTWFLKGHFERDKLEERCIPGTLLPCWKCSFFTVQLFCSAGATSAGVLPLRINCVVRTEIYKIKWIKEGKVTLYSPLSIIQTVDPWIPAAITHSWYRFLISMVALLLGGWDGCEGHLVPWLHRPYRYEGLQVRILSLRRCTHAKPFRTMSHQQSGDNLRTKSNWYLFENVIIISYNII